MQCAQERGRVGPQATLLQAPNQLVICQAAWKQFEQGRYRSFKQTLAPCSSPPQAAERHRRLDAVELPRIVKPHAEGRSTCAYWRSGHHLGAAERVGQTFLYSLNAKPEALIADQQLIITAFCTGAIAVTLTLLNPAFAASLLRTRTALSSDGTGSHILFRQDIPDNSTPSASGLWLDTLAKLEVSISGAKI